MPSQGVIYPNAPGHCLATGSIIFKSTKLLVSLSPVQLLTVFQKCHFAILLPFSLPSSFHSFLPLSIVFFLPLSASYFLLFLPYFVCVFVPPFCLDFNLSTISENYAYLVPFSVHSEEERKEKGRSFRKIF
jgi:hypothetical protein